MMYNLEKNYRLEMKKNKTFYTGKILQEDAISIKLRTIKNETIILNKDEIKKAIEFETDNEEDKDDEKKCVRKETLH